ncbi:hypothetical protein [Halobacteriovorax sp.]|uniref:hypothetical protein n=1 Tax=Halobacteriovorax sp. TaxID=2020862 RepID=UPI00356989E4
MSLANLSPVLEDFHVKAIFEGISGDLIAEPRRVSFYDGDMLIHRTPYEQLTDIKFREIGEKSFLDLCIEGGHIAFNLVESEDDSEFFYLHTKERIINQNEINEFLKENIRVEENRALLMFDRECITWMMDQRPFLFSGEYIKGALIGRLSQDFSHHEFGVLYVTNNRLFFNGRKGELRELPLESVRHCLLIDIDKKFRDVKSRKSYSLQFNQGELTVGVQSEFYGKIESFLNTFDEEIIEIERF